MWRISPLQSNFTRGVISPTNKQLLIDGRLSLSPPLSQLVWHSRDVFPYDGPASHPPPSLKPSQPFRRRHHKSLISPCLGCFLGPGYQSSPFTSIPCLTPLLLLLLTCHPHSFLPLAVSPFSRWIRCFFFSPAVKSRQPEATQPPRIKRSPGK